MFFKTEVERLLWIFLYSQLILPLNITIIYKQYTFNMQTVASTKIKYKIEDYVSSERAQPIIQNFS